MSIAVSTFDYFLPQNLIAQKPIIPRESARLMVLNKTSKNIRHKYIRDLPNFFQKGDVIVVNNTKVFKARLFGLIIIGHGIKTKVEILLIKPIDQTHWQAIGQPNRKLIPGRKIIFHDDFFADITANYGSSIIINFNSDAESVVKKANQYGLVPVPHYIKNQPKLSDYQTSYAKIVGSVAAPTAGLHLTSNIRKIIKKKGATICEITLHVGLGTFMPIKTSNIEDHKMHNEWINIPSKTADIINLAKQTQQRIIAIGTTTVRALEGTAKIFNGIIKPYSGDINLFITPGFRFQYVNGLLTNFHLPKSTLIILVSTFAGKNFIVKAYNEAIYKNYRFYSFGDAMLIM